MGITWRTDNGCHLVGSYFFGAVALGGFLARKGREAQGKPAREPNLIVKAVLWSTETVVEIFVILATLIGVAMGFFANLYISSLFFNSTGESDAWFFMLIGGFIGFMFAALMSSVVLTLTQIEKNTRQMSELFFKIVNRNSDQN